MSRRLPPDYVTDADVAGEGAGVVAMTRRPDLTVQGVVENKSSELARFAEDCPGAFRMIEKVVAAVQHFAARNGLDPRDVEVALPHTRAVPSGALFVALIRRRARRRSAPRQVGRKRIWTPR